ncbi:MAG: carbohydrate-binding family 9-like protein [Acidobacteriota bacterium]|nr:carbohydrate-binding family 9-like protein [Acidobacteriota bacterium]
MTRSLRIFAVLAFLAVGAAAAGVEVATSKLAPRDVTVNSDPKSRFWRLAPAIFAEKDKSGKSLPGYRTEVRSRWTGEYLYFLFICPYEELLLKPNPSTQAETNQLWNWDVAEVFLGSDFQNIRRYKEFELSPQGEWIDLDIDLAKPHHEEGWTWNSGFQVTARIDHKSKVWYGAMKIPWSALSEASPAVGKTFRVNFFRSQGPLATRKDIAWQPTMSETFHIPERFGLLKLAADH